MGRNHETMARAHRAVRRPASTTTSRGTSSRTSTPTTRRSIVEQVRNDVSLSALKGLIIKLGGLREGRKALILVSEGYTELPAAADAVAERPGQGRQCGDPFAGDSMGEQRERFFSQAEMMSRLKDVYDLANRNNVSIYASIPRGLAAFEGDIDEGVGGISLTTDRDMLRLTMDSIQMLADNTDGRAIVNTNDLRQGHAADRARSERLLSARLQLEARAERRQVPRDQGQGERGRASRCAHRKGYVAFTKEDLTRAMAPPGPSGRRTSMRRWRRSCRRARGDYIRSWLGMSRGNNGKTKLTFVWEPVPAAASGAREPPKITLTAIGPDGAPYLPRQEPVAPATGPR